MLLSGGNAIDAGVAAGLCLCVLESDMANFAGVAPIMIYQAEHRRVLTISGLGRWPAQATVGFFAENCESKIPMGVLRCVSPGAPDAWIVALKEFGTRSFEEVATEAIELAENGFSMHPFMSANIRRSAKRISAWPSSSSIFLPEGRVPGVDEVFLQRDLARTLHRLVEAERAARGSGREAGLEAVRQRFYRGDLAEEISAFFETEGGLLRYEDLASFRVQIENAVAVQFHDYTIYTCGPWCQGPVLGQVLQLLHPYDLQRLGHNSLEYVHLLTEALKLAFADREAFYGDPEFVSVPIDELLSPRYAAARRGLIDGNRAHPGMPPAGQDLLLDVGGNPTNAPSFEVGSASANTPDTTYVCVVDGQGNVFSATPSDGCLNGPVTPGTGLGISTRGSQSWVLEGHASAVAPGKRPRLTPCPALIFKNGRPYMPLGTPGGDVQCQAMLQVFLNVAVFGMSPQAAIEAPRFATYSFPGSFEPHDYLPGELRVEGRLNSEIGEGLAEKGHHVIDWPDWTWMAGGVCAITIDHDRGLLAAGADPRRMGYAIGW